MPQSRRQLLTTFVAAAGALAATPVLASALQHSPQPIPSPNAPTNQNFPAGLDGPTNKPTEEKKQIDPKRQEEIRTDIQKLYDLAAQLKEETGKSDLNSTLPVSLVKKAQEIEKLAKKIRNLSQG